MWCLFYFGAEESFCRFQMKTMIQDNIAVFQFYCTSTINSNKFQQSNRLYAMHIAEIQSEPIKRGKGNETK